MNPRFALYSTLAVVLLSDIVRANNLFVPSQFPTIQAAINAAVNDDEVVIAPGLYVGAGNTNVSFGGKAITVRSSDPLDPAIVAATIIDGGGSARGFEFFNGEGPDSILSGLTIRNMATTGGGGGNTGSGIRTRLFSTPTITDCVVTGCINTAVLSTQNSGFTLERCTITGNTSAPLNFGAGGVYVTYNGTAVVRNCVISNNFGGGIVASSANSLTLTDSLIANNTGGGVSAGSGVDLQLLRCRILGNTSGFSGGGVALSPFGDTNIMVIRDCLIAGNVAATHGGGLAVHGFLDSNITMTHVTITGNQAGTNGGGLSCSADEGVMNHCIVWNNDAATDGGGDNLYMGFATNGLIQQVANLAVDYCVLPNANGSQSLHPTAQLALGEGVLDVDPLFADPGTGDYHLSSASPCIGAGDPALIPAPGETDIDGDPRLLGPIVDIGADEFRLPGDFDSDGDVDAADRDLFVAVLLGHETDELRRAQADINHDGLADGKDIAEFVGLLIGG